MNFENIHKVAIQVYVKYLMTINISGNVSGYIKMASIYVNNQQAFGGTYTGWITDRKYNGFGEVTSMCNISITGNWKSNVKTGRFQEITFDNRTTERRIYDYNCGNVESHIIHKYDDTGYNNIVFIGSYHKNAGTPYEYNEYTKHCLDYRNDQGRVTANKKRNDAHIIDRRTIYDNGNVKLNEELFAVSV